MKLNLFDLPYGYKYKQIEFPELAEFPELSDRPEVMISAQETTPELQAQMPEAIRVPYESGATISLHEVWMDPSIDSPPTVIFLPDEELLRFANYLASVALTHKQQQGDKHG